MAKVLNEINSETVIVNSWDCSCGEGQKTGIPCCHLLAVARTNKSRSYLSLFNDRWKRSRQTDEEDLSEWLTPYQDYYNLFKLQLTKNHDLCMKSGMLSLGLVLTKLFENSSASYSVKFSFVTLLPSLGFLKQETTRSEGISCLSSRHSSSPKSLSSRISYSRFGS